MPSPELRRLHELHEVDRAILEIRKRAAALNVGQDIQKKIDMLEQNLVKGEGAEAKKLVAEVADLEFSINSHQEKAKKIEADLYSGKIVNIREVEAFRADMKQHQDAASKAEDVLLAKMDQVETAKTLLSRIDAKLAELRRQLSDRQKAAQVERDRLTSEYERLKLLRPAKAKEVGPALLARYDGIRKSYETGMADVKNSSCGGCGNILPERIMTLLKDEKVMTCEQCHRILYYTEGLI